MNLEKESLYDYLKDKIDFEIVIKLNDDFKVFGVLKKINLDFLVLFLIYKKTERIICLNDIKGVEILSNKTCKGGRP